MKVSVSLPEEDIRFLDGYSKKAGIESRSAALHRAVRLLKASQLGSAYEMAWKEWEGSSDLELWETVSADGIKR